MDTDIIIPIYNAFDFTKKCIETVIEHTDLTKHTLLLINDKSTDQRILPLLNLFTTEYPSLWILHVDKDTPFLFFALYSLSYFLSALKAQASLFAT